MTGPVVASIRLKSANKANMADFCFMAVNIERVGNAVSYFKAKCILCGKTYECFQSNGENQPRTFKQQYLLQHLLNCHNSVNTLLKLHVIHISDTPTIPRQEKQSDIISFFGKRSKSTDSQVDIIPVIPVVDDIISIPPPLSIINRQDVMKTMRIIMSNIALSWNKHGKGSDLYWDSELATYYESNRMIPRLYDHMRFYIKELMRSIPDYSYSCDCLSVANVKFKAICFFVHFYYRNKFVSLLLDVKRIDNSKAGSIKDIFLEVVKDYGLD